VSERSGEHANSRTHLVRWPQKKERRKESFDKRRTRTFIPWSSCLKITCNVTSSRLTSATFFSLHTYACVSHLSPKTRQVLKKDKSRKRKCLFEKKHLLFANVRKGSNFAKKKLELPFSHTNLSYFFFFFALLMMWFSRDDDEKVRFPFSWIIDEEMTTFHWAGKNTECNFLACNCVDVNKFAF